MAEVLHPSAIEWPLPHGTKFPHTQQVKCAFCNTQGIRVITTRVQAQSLHYCNAACKQSRREAVRSGLMIGVNHIPKPVIEVTGEGNWGDLGLAPRRSIKAFKKPTDYDYIYGSMKSRDSDLKE